MFKCSTLHWADVMQDERRRRSKSFTNDRDAAVEDAEIKKAVREVNSRDAERR